MAAISKMNKWVAHNTPGCPEPLIEEYLRMSAIDLCRESFVWRDSFQETLQALDFPFQVSASGGAKVIKVLSIAEPGYDPLEEKTIRECDLGIPDWKIATGVPIYFVNEPSDMVNIVPMPLEPKTFDITVAYEPTETATSIPDALYEDHRDTIISGALMRLFLLPGKEWTNPDMAVVHKRIYESGVAVASRIFTLNHTHAAMSTSISPI